MSKVTVIALGTALMLVSAAAAAETYRWVDAEGNVQYGDRPVRGSQAVDIRTAGETPATGHTPLPVAANDDEFADEAEGEESSTENDSPEDVRAQLCTQAKDRLERYEMADGIYEEGPDGQRRQLSVDERVETILQARQSVKNLCEAPTTAETETVP